MSTPTTTLHLLTRDGAITATFTPLLTAEQYDSLVKLTATLCTVLPRIGCDYPRDDQGALLTSAMDEDRPPAPPPPSSGD
jgi:hypothetical protein